MPIIDYSSELQSTKLFPSSSPTTQAGTSDYSAELIPPRTSGKLATFISNAMSGVPVENISRSTTLSTYLSEYPTEKKSYDAEYQSAMDANDLKGMGEVQEKYLGRAKQLRGAGPERTLGEVTQVPLTGLMSAGAVSHPVALGIGLAGFQLMDNMFNLRRMLPQDTSPTVKDVAELLDFTIKGGILGKVMGRYTKPPLSTVDKGGNVQVVEQGQLGGPNTKLLPPPPWYKPGTIYQQGQVTNPLAQLVGPDTKLLPPPAWYKPGTIYQEGQVTNPLAQLLGPKEQLLLPGKVGTIYGELPPDMQPGVIQGQPPTPPAGLLEYREPSEQTGWKSAKTGEVVSEGEVPSGVVKLKPEKQWVTYKRINANGDIIQSGTVNIGDTLLEGLKNREGVIITRIATDPPIKLSYTFKKDYALPEPTYKPIVKEQLGRVEKVGEGAGVQVVGKEEAGIVEDTTPPQIAKRTLTPEEMVEQERIIREEWDDHQKSKEKIIKFHSGPDFEKALKDLISSYSSLSNTLRNFSSISPSEKVVDRVVDNWGGAINRGDLTSKWIMEDIQKAVPNQVRRELIANVMEGTQPESLLAPSEVKVMSSLKRMYSDLYEFATKEDVVHSHLGNYVTHIYTDAPEVVNAKLGKWRMGLAKSFRFGKQRLIPTIAEAKMAGLHPVEDVSLVLPEYSRQLFKTIANRNLIDTLNNTFDENGIAYAKKPNVAKTIGDLTDPALTYSTWMKRYTNTRSLVKRIIMFNPAIHGWNMFSVAVNETNFNIPKAIGLIGKGGKLWKNRDQLVREMVDNGLNTTGGLGEELRTRLMHSPDPITHSIMNDIHTVKDRITKWSDEVLWEGIVRNGQIGLYQLEKGKLMKGGLDAKSAGKAAAHILNDFFGTLPQHWMTPLERSAGSTLLLARNWTYSNLRMVSGTLGEYSDSRFLPHFLRHKGLTPEQMTAAQRVYVSHIIKGVAGLIMYSNLLQIGALTLKAKREKKDIAQAWKDGTIHMTWENPPGKKLDIDVGVRDKLGRDKYLVNPLFRYIKDYFSWGTDPARTIYNKMEPILKSSLESLLNFQPWRRKAVTEKEGIVGTMERLGHLGKGVTPWRSIVDPLTGQQSETSNVLTPIERLAPLIGTWTTSALAYPALTLRTLSTRDRHLFTDTLTPSERLQLQKQTQEGMIRGELAQKLMEFRKSQHIADSDIDQRISTLSQQGRYTEALDAIMESRRYSTRESIRRKMREWRERQGVH